MQRTLENEKEALYKLLENANQGTYSNHTVTQLFIHPFHAHASTYSLLVYPHMLTYLTSPPMCVYRDQYDNRYDAIYRRARS